MLDHVISWKFHRNSSTIFSVIWLTDRHINIYLLVEIKWLSAKNSSASHLCDYIFFQTCTCYHSYPWKAGSTVSIMFLWTQSWFSLHCHVRSSKRYRWILPKPRELFTTWLIAVCVTEGLCVRVGGHQHQSTTGDFHNFSSPCTSQTSSQWGVWSKTSSNRNPLDPYNM